MKKTLNFHFNNFSLEDIGEITMCGGRVLLYEDVLDGMVDYDDLIIRDILTADEDHVYFDMNDTDEPLGYKKFFPDMFEEIRHCRMICDPEFFITDDGFSVVFEGPEQHKIDFIKKVVKQGLTW